MSTEIILNLKRVLRARPRESLSVVLQRAIRPGEHLESVSTTERRIEAADLEETVAVGTKPWTVQVQSQPRNVADLESRIAALERDKEQDAVLWGEGYVRNVAAQALLFAVGEQPKHASSSSRFQQEAAAGSSKLKAFLDNSSFQGVTMAAFAVQADDIIDSRNQSVHYRSLSDSEWHVFSASTLLQRYPSLQTRCSLESRLLDDFPELKKAFGISGETRREQDLFAMQSAASRAYIG